MAGPDVKSLLRDAFGQFVSTRAIVAAYLYGSHARGQAGPGSDIDVAVLLESGREAAPMEPLRLGNELEDKTGLKNIDVRLLNDAPLSTRGRILSEGQLVYSGDDAARVDFEVATRSLYFDFLPHLNYIRQAFIKRTAEKGL